MIHPSFPFTKFLPPLLDERVSAGGIATRLDVAVASHPLTLVSAPAGSGKTTALAAWARGSTTAVAWLRLDEADDSAPAAAAALLAGTRRIREGFGRRLEQVLHNREASGSVTHLVTSLVNDLGDGDPLFLVLDDFHVLRSPDSQALFDRLLDQLPAHVRVLIGSRGEPDLSLPRRRVRAQVAEFGLEELRLDREAIRRLLDAADADDSLVSRVEEETGGWAAAVRLYVARTGTRSKMPEGGAAGERSGSRGLTRDGERSGRLPPPVRQDLWRYLTEEVWNAAPESLQAFLLDSCILDEITAEVCDLVRGRSDSLDLLHEVERRNLFVSRHASGETEGWRYHDLFRDFLRERLRASREPESVRELHRRAAVALPGAGGIAHLLAADEYDGAARRIVEAGQGGSFLVSSGQLIPWIQRLPDDVRARHPRVDLLLAGFDELRGRLAEVRTRLEPLRDRLRATGDLATAAEASAGLISSYIVAGDFVSARAAVADALENPLPAWLRGGVLVMGGWIEYHQARWPEADAILQEALELAVTDGDPEVASLVALGVVSPMLLLSRDRPRMLERTRQLVARLEGREGVSLAGPRCVLAASSLLRLDVGSADRIARSCLRETREFGGLPWVDQDAERLLLVIHLARSDHAGVTALVDAAVGRMPSSEVDDAERWGYAYAAIRSDLLLGKRPGIAATAARLLHGGPRGPAETIVSAIAAALDARSEGRFGDADARLREAEDFQRESPFWLCAGLPGLELASGLLERGLTIAAIDAAEPTLNVAAERGAGILLSEVEAHRTLLQACAAAGIQTQTIRAALTVAESEAAPAARWLPGTAERISVREVEVLRLIAAGLSNRQVAEDLFISEVTVKSHLTRINRKLGARSRTHAVALARDLRLV